MHRNQKRRGYTLIELVFTLGVTIATMGIVLSCLKLTGASYMKLASTIQQQRSLHSLGATLRRDGHQGLTLASAGQDSDSAVSWRGHAGQVAYRSETDQVVRVLRNGAGEETNLQSWEFPAAQAIEFSVSSSGQLVSCRIQTASGEHVLTTAIHVVEDAP